MMPFKFSWLDNYSKDLAHYQKSVGKEYKSGFINQSGYIIIAEKIVEKWVVR